MTRRRLLLGSVVGLAILLITWGANTAKGKTSGNEHAEGKGNGSSGKFEKYRFDYFDNFYGIASPTPSCYWIVGNSGRILFSLDGGRTWQVQESHTKENLFAVTFADLRNGWACGGGGTILHTADGGDSWAPQNSGTNHPIFRIQFVNGKTGFACGYFGLFLRTTDGGKTWENKSIGEDVTLRGMSFVGEKVGYLVGEFGTILKTQDGGSSFSRLNSPVPLTLFAVHFPGAKTGYAAGVDGTILRTSDGGRTWNKEKSGVKDHLIGIYGNGQAVVGVGLRGAVTARGPEGKWSPADPKTLSWLSAIFVSGDGTGYAVGAHGTILPLGGILNKAEVK